MPSMSGNLIVQKLFLELERESTTGKALDLHTVDLDSIPRTSAEVLRAQSTEHRARSKHSAGCNLNQPKTTTKALPGKDKVVQVNLTI